MPPIIIKQDNDFVYVEQTVKRIHKKRMRYLDRGYVMFFVGYDYPRNNCGYRREHDYIVEQKIGRMLRLDEEVHHINGDKKDNRLENLALVSKKNHGLHHRKKYSPLTHTFV